MRSTSRMVIWGERTGLVRFEERRSESDIHRIYEWSQDEELLRWSGGGVMDLSFDDFKEHLLGEQMYGPRNRRAFFILRKDTHELIGRLGLFGIDWTKRQGELGIIIGQKEYWGQGYGRDAIQTFLRHLFKTSSLQRVYLFTFVNNLRAQHSFASVGFRPLRRVHRSLPDLGDFEGLEMEILREEFLERDRPLPEEEP